MLWTMMDNDGQMMLDGNMSPGTPQKFKTDSQDVANRATPNQLTVPEVTNLTERPLEWRDDDQPKLSQAKKKMKNVEKDVLSSKEIKSVTSAKNPNPVAGGDFSQNNSNLGQNSLPNSKDGQSDDPKGQKQTKRGSIQSPMKNKEILPVKGNLPPFPTISIVSPQGEERTASLDKEEEESGYGQEKSGETKDSGEYSSDKFIEEGDPQSGESSVNLSDKDSDEGSATNDQRRALLELEQQQEEIANSVLHPFESNIKSRLHQLNWELANEEPQKLERTTKVAFREDLVQVISPTEASKDAKIAKARLKETKKYEDLDEDLEPKKDVSDSSLETIFDMVVERDGHFDLVTPEDMTASADYIKGRLSSQHEKTQLLGSRPRPSSAIITRSSPTFRIPNSRPISCPIYNSPYGLTPKQKELVHKKLTLQEQVRREEEESRKMREKQKRMLNEEAFQCWLRRIRENEQALRKKEELAREMQRKEKEEKENQQKKQNEDMFRKWIQSKCDQQKQEEMLKWHEDEIYNSFLQPRSQEDVDRAYRKWLKKKSQETRRQKFLAKQKYRLQQRLLRRSRLIRNMTWDVCLNNSFHFTDHYGLDPQAYNIWNTVVFSNQPGYVIPSELSPWQSTSGFKQENLMTPSNLSNSLKPQTNATGMDAREIVVLEDPLDPNNLQHQTEIVQNVTYSEDVGTGPDCHLSKKQSELCAVPPPNKSPRLNSSGRNLLVHTQTTQQPGFSTQTSNVTSTTPSPVSKTTTQRQVENEAKANTFPTNLSAKNVKMNTGENLTRDTVYLLKGLDGIQFTAVWNGQHFKQFPGG